MNISIIIPAYNEEKRIGKTLEEYGKFFKGLKKYKKFNFEIIVVINNTKDNTELIVKEYSKKYREIKYLNFKQGGKGFAITEGFKEAIKRKNDLIGFIDADMATSPKEFFKLIENINDYDGIIASRAKRGAVAEMTFLRKITHRGFNFLVRSLFLMPYEDTQCGAKLFKKYTVESILPDLSITQWAFDVNLLYSCKRKKFKIKEYPTIWKNKENSKITDLLRTSLQMFLGIVRLRLIYSFLEPFLKPVKFILKIGNKIFNKK